MLVSISRQQTTDSSLSASMVQDADRTTRIVRANDRVATARTVHRTVEAASSCLGVVPNSAKHTIGKQLPEQFTLCSIAGRGKSTASSTQSSSDHTLRESGDTNTHSVATSIASFASCAPTLTLSPSGSPRTRRNSFHAVRRASTASSQSSDCHCAADASVRSTIGYSDDEDETVGESTVTNAKKNNGNCKSSVQPEQEQEQSTQGTQNQTPDATSRRTHGAASLPNEDRKKTAGIRRTYSLTKETRRKVVSMHMPSNFMLATPVASVIAPAAAPVVAHAEGLKQKQKQSVAAAAETASHSISSASSKSDENRGDAEPTSTKVGATLTGQKQGRKIVPGASNVIAIKQSANANRVLTTSTAAAFASSPTNGSVNFSEEISQSPASGSRYLADLENRAKASSHERLAGNPAMVVSAAQQPPNDKLLLPDKNLFTRKSQWSSESTLNILPQSAAQNAPVQATPKPLPQPLGNVNVAQSKQRAAKANSMEESDTVFDENHQNNNPTASAHQPVKVSHVQQPLRSDKPASQVETTSRSSICSATSKAARSKQQQYQAVYVSTPLQYQPSASSTLTTTTASNFDDTDIDIDWDELSGVASDNSIPPALLKGQYPSRSIQSTVQPEMIGMVEAYEMYLNELDVIVQKERQQFEQVRMGTISIECWRETAKRILQFKVVAVEQMQKLLE